MKIEILEIRFLDTGKPLKAFVNALVNDWVVRDFRIIQQDGQRAYVMPPQVSWRDTDSGAIKYKGILTIPIEEKQMIDIAILSAYQREKERLDAHPR